MVDSIFYSFIRHIGKASRLAVVCRLVRLQAINVPLQQCSSICLLNLNEHETMAKETFKENQSVLSWLTSIVNLYVDINQTID